jgi:hypothetical protein
MSLENYFSIPKAKLIIFSNQDQKFIHIGVPLGGTKERLDEVDADIGVAGLVFRDASTLYIDNLYDHTSFN